MMKIEKEFAKMDLSSLKETPVKLFAKNCIQYQDFKANDALDKFNYAGTGWNRTTAMTYFQNIRKYLKTGKFCNRACSTKLKKEVDALKYRYVALVPKDEEKWDGKLSISDKDNTEMKKQETKQEEYVVKFIYAVCLSNIFYTFQTQHEADIFSQALDVANVEYKIKKISIIEE